MYLSGIIVTLIGVYVNDGDKVLEKGFFFGYTPWVCFVVCKYDKSKKGFRFEFSLLFSVLAYITLSTPSFGQCGWPVHISGGEVHR